MPRSRWGIIVHLTETRRAHHRVVETGSGRRKIRSRLRRVVVIVGLAAVLLVLVAITTSNPLGGGAAPESDGDERLGAVPTTWSSGAAGDGVADGTFGAWRGDPVDIAATWNDSADAQVNQWTLQPGAEFADWDKDLDLSVGAIYREDGETWADAAAGAYDDRWRQALEVIAQARAGHTGTLYLRFAHEFNGEWEPWSVSGSDTEAFRTAWSRFRDLQLQILPDAKLVFCPTSDTSDSLGLDWREAFPDPEDVDVVSVDYYNQYPFVNTLDDFDQSLGATDEQGAPRGLEEFRRFAEEQGLPMAISEWNSNGDMGDSALFVKAFRQWVADHAGTGAGDVLYEIQFNVGQFGDGQFQLYPDSKQPEAAAAYRRLW